MKVTNAAVSIIGILPPYFAPILPPKTIPNVSITLKIAPLANILPVLTAYIVYAPVTQL